MGMDSSMGSQPEEPTDTPSDTDTEQPTKW
jgi:hypothetical protein